MEPTAVTFEKGSLAGLFLLSASTLAFEINLTRLFSVAQFYHFAFLIVSLALLGFGASGTYLVLFPRRESQHAGERAFWFALACSASLTGAYLLVNWLPFDSFKIAWDARQVFFFVLNYLALATPFFFSGLAVGSLLAAFPHKTSQLYGANLLGSAAGCAAALAAPGLLGGEGIVALCSGLAAVAAMCFTGGPQMRVHPPLSKRGAAGTAVLLGLLIFCGLDLGLRMSTGSPIPWMQLRLSPYKSLSYALQYPGARLISQRWNAISRVDVVRSPGIRSLPGLSYRYLEAPPAEDGLLVDGDELSPVLLPGYETGFAAYLPAAIAFELRPGANTLVLEPRGGLDVITALALGAGQATAVEANPLVVEAAAESYNQAGVRLVVDSGRSYTRRAGEDFDVILLSLAQSYHPVRSGVYSLGEDYRYTVESFEDAMNRLAPEGLLVASRWLQTPPSEELRAFALAVQAVEGTGGDPRRQIVAFRGYNTATILVKNGFFSNQELEAIRQFAATRAFDLIFAPDLRPEETNRYNILPEDTYAQSFQALLDAQPRQAFYKAYPFEIEPPSDDRPFFGHYFRWSQTGQVLAELGKTWQPFGGAGYLAVLALLALVSILAALLILLPAAALQLKQGSDPKPNNDPERSSTASILFYFAMIGLAYLLVEIPLMQRFILYLGQPAYALATVLFTLLLFSGLGSLASQRIPLRLGLGLLVLLLISLPVWLPRITDLSLGASLPARLGLTVLMLGPLGLLMGTAFPNGIAWGVARQGSPALIPWIWATNGSFSVVASVLAALLALSFGFNWVLRLGALCYALAWLAVRASARRDPG